MATNCNASVSARAPSSEVGSSEARQSSDEVTGIEKGFHRIVSSLLELAQGQDLSTVCNSLSHLKQDTEECLRSGCSPIFCPTFPTNVRHTVSEFRFLLELKEHISQLPCEQLRAKSAELEKFLGYTEWDFKDSQVGLESEVVRLAGFYAMRMSQFASQTSEQLSDDIREQFRLLEEVNRSERSIRMSSFVQARLQQLLGNWQSPFEESSVELFQHAAARFARHGCELITGIRLSARSLLGCSAQCADWCEEFEASDCFTCFRGRGPDCFPSRMPLQLPTVHFRKHLLRRTLRNTSVDLLGYVSDAVEEHKNHLDKCCSDLIRRMAGQISETKDGICEVIERSLWKSEHQSKSASAEHLPEENRDVLGTLDRYTVELDLLLCRWESVGDTAREETLNV